MLRKLVIGALWAAIVSTSGAYAAATSDSAALPAEFTAKSNYRLDYSDLEAVLRGSVLEMGRSTHQRAPKPTKSTGSNMRLGNPKPSRLEGNRVMLHEYGKQQKDGIAAVRDDLLRVPERLPIEKLSKNEQLAYWLNLHNVIVLSKVSEIYPITMLDNSFNAASDTSLLDDREYEWMGQKISLADIQNHVLKNWADPVVIYGFYLGAVGTPNIRNSAYTGANVHAALKDNAEDFINSVRGTQVWNKTKLRVSTYYEIMAQKFPNFEVDLKAHIRKYAANRLKNRLKTVKRMTVDIDDWHIADLYNGNFGELGGTYAGTVTDGYGNSLKSALPEHVTDLLNDRVTKLSRQHGTVGVEEVSKKKKNDKNR